MFTFTKAMTCFVLCAWIMWSKTYINDEQKDVTIVSAWLTIDECDRALSDLEDRYRRDGKKAQPGIVHYNSRQYSTLICLPDTVKLN